MNRMLLNHQMNASEACCGCCNCSPAECYSKGYEAGFAEGLEKGCAQGFAKGKAEGLAEGLAEGACRERRRICQLLGCNDLCECRQCHH